MDEEPPEPPNANWQTPGFSARGNSEERPGPQLPPRPPQRSASASPRRDGPAPPRPAAAGTDSNARGPSKDGAGAEQPNSARRPPRPNGGFSRGPSKDGAPTEQPNSARKSPSLRPSGGSATSTPKSAGGAAKQEVDTETLEREKWASERLVKLQKELRDLEGCEAAERKRGIRVLQRELHPDKQPPEMHVHVQPLFHIVQREWEVVEAQQKRAEAAAAD